MTVSTLEGESLVDKLAAFDRAQGKPPIDGARIEGDPGPPSDPVDDPERRAHAASPMVDLGRGASPAERLDREASVPPPDAGPDASLAAQMEHAMRQAGLAVLGTWACVNGRDTQLTEDAFKKIQRIVIQSAIGELKDMEAMLGVRASDATKPSGVVVPEPPAEVSDRNRIDLLDKHGNVVNEPRISVGRKASRCSKCVKMGRDGLGHNARTHDKLEKAGSL